MKKFYLSILMTLCPLLPGMAQQVSQTGRETVGQTGLRASAAQTPKPFLQEGKEWYTRCVHYFLGEFFTQSGSRVIRSWTESPTRNCMMETW